MTKFPYTILAIALLSGGCDNASTLERAEEAEDPVWLCADGEFGTLLSKHAYSDCRKGFWHNVEDHTYQCADGSIHTFEARDVKTNDKCGGGTGGGGGEGGSAGMGGGSTDVACFIDADCAGCCDAFYEGESFYSCLETCG